MGKIQARMAAIMVALWLIVPVKMGAQVLHYDKPATFFEEALVVGNGTMGGIIYGGTEQDKVSLNDITLWTGEPSSMNVFSPEAYKSIPAIREALRKGDYPEADRLQRNVQGHFSQNYQPLGQLTIDYLNTSEGVTGYRRWLDIGNATAHTSYQRGAYRYTAEYFASHPDSGIVIRIATDNPSGIRARIGLSCQLKSQLHAEEGGVLVNDGMLAMPLFQTIIMHRKGFPMTPKEAFAFERKCR